MTTRAMFALTIWQPWATLIAESAKHFEFRRWAPARSMWGTSIAIHAGARPVRRNEVRELLIKLESSHWRETGLEREQSIALLERVWLAPGSLPLSSVVCLATLGEPIRNDALAARLGLAPDGDAIWSLTGRIGSPPLNDSDRDEHSNYGWPLTDIRRLEPFVPARGAQGFWIWRSPT